MTAAAANPLANAAARGDIRAGGGASKLKSYPVAEMEVHARLPAPTEATDKSSDAELCRGTVIYNKNSVFHQRVELYRGSVSVVYKAICGTTHKHVIVKAYKTHRMNKKQTHKTKREIEIMQQMRGDPGVVQYLGHFEDAYMTFIVMEHCKQGDLFRNLFLKGGSVDEYWAATKIINPLLDTLSRLHALNILHRDIKPENLFLTEDWKLRLGDFGLAVNSTIELPFTRSGTLDYMAPEVLSNPATDLTEGPCTSLGSLKSRGVTPYTDKVDIWAVGILTYELVVGKPPFEVDNEQYTMKLIINSTRLNFPPHLSKEWKDFISIALMKDPKKRPSATELLCHPWIHKHMPPSRSNDSCKSASDLQIGKASHPRSRPVSASMAQQKSTSVTDAKMSQEMASLGIHPLRKNHGGAYSAHSPPPLTPDTPPVGTVPSPYSSQTSPVSPSIGARMEELSMPSVVVRSPAFLKSNMKMGVIDQASDLAHSTPISTSSMGHSSSSTVLQHSVTMPAPFQGRCQADEATGKDSKQLPGNSRWGNRIKQYFQRQMGKAA
eukprot:CAMPEP_0117697884 /NCGR_PEP_ID=MMETSP0804-20121206/29475_1 /TAXON_ID=1074897 /ORGANISM="Tetraselmis astigmatica, Strain CCMP880" /LENGTH=549 /DNA_ID=CAMNT_0005512181 /DNA_START=1383 /DNA_END=3032 /DNA_ORIENTATION=+